MCHAQPFESTHYLKCSIHAFIYPSYPSAHTEYKQTTKTYIRIACFRFACPIQSLFVVLCIPTCSCSVCVVPSLLSPFHRQNSLGTFQPFWIFVSSFFSSLPFAFIFVLSFLSLSFFLSSSFLLHPPSLLLNRQTPSHILSCFPNFVFHTFSSTCSRSLPIVHTCFSIIFCLSFYVLSWQKSFAYSFLNHQKPLWLTLSDFLYSEPRYQGFLPLFFCQFFFIPWRFQGLRDVHIYPRTFLVQFCSFLLSLCIIIYQHHFCTVTLHLFFSSSGSSYSWSPLQQNKQQKSQIYTPFTRASIRRPFHYFVFS